MKEKVIQQFDKSELEIIKGMVSIGIKKNEALIMLALTRKPHITSRDISTITDLRQPEVSIGCKVLLEKDWIEYITETSKGKGRHHYIYNCNYNINDVIEEYKRDMITGINKLQEDLNQG